MKKILSITVPTKNKFNKGSYMKFTEFLNETLDIKNTKGILETLFITPVILADGLDKTKDNKKLIEVIKAAKRILGDYDLEQLNKSYSSQDLIIMFKEMTNHRGTVEQLLNDFENNLIRSAKSFMDSYEIHNSFELFRKSKEFNNYIKMIKE